jgi:hypothetical protein
MKVSTTYTFKANSSYIYYDGRLNFTDRRDPNNEVALDIELSFDELCRLSEQLDARIKRVKQDRIDKARKELEEASEEC